MTPRRPDGQIRGARGLVCASIPVHAGPDRGPGPRVGAPFRRSPHGVQLDRRHFENRHRGVAGRRHRAIRCRRARRSRHTAAGAGVSLLLLPSLLSPARRAGHLGIHHFYGPDWVSTDWTGWPPSHRRSCCAAISSDPGRRSYSVGFLRHTSSEHQSQLRARAGSGTCKVTATWRFTSRRGCVSWPWHCAPGCAGRQLRRPPGPVAFGATRRGAYDSSGAAGTPRLEHTFQPRPR